TAHHEQRWGIIGGRQGRRIVRFEPADQPRIEGGETLELAVGRVGGADAKSAAAAAPRKIRQRVEGRGCRTEALEKLEERDRSDALAAEEPQPVPPLGLGERLAPAHAGLLFAPIRGSSPRSRRRMFV